MTPAEILLQDDVKDRLADLRSAVNQRWLVEDAHDDQADYDLARDSGYLKACGLEAAAELALIETIVATQSA